MEHPRKLPPIFDERFWGKCSFCHCVITPENFKRHEIVAAMTPTGSAMACARHFTTDGKERAPTFREALQALAKEANQIGVLHVPDALCNYFGGK